MDSSQQYTEAFIEALGASADELDDSFTFDAVDRWDSMSHLALVTELEDRFDIVLDPDDILHFGSYANGMKILEKYGVTF